MKQTAIDGRVMSAGWWLDKAILLTALWGDLKDEMNKYEMIFKSEESKLIESGKKISEAERIIQGTSEAYKMYLYLNSRDEVIQEFIRLAKVRARINDNE